MKPIREYINQLDEISRRDFLKGAGVATGLVATGGAQAGGLFKSPFVVSSGIPNTDPGIVKSNPFKSNADRSLLTDADFQEITKLIYIMYLAMTENGKNDPDFREAFFTLKDFYQVYEYPIHSTMTTIKSRVEGWKQNEPERYQRFYQNFITNQQNKNLIINAVKLINKKGEDSLKENTIGESSLDAVQRIEDLVKYK